MQQKKQSPKMTTKKIKTKKLTRVTNGAILTREFDEEARTVEMSFSSEEPYARYFGIEVLGHGDGEISLDWLNSGNAPVLKDHWGSEQIGVVESARVEGGRGVAVVRFGKSDLAEQEWIDVKDGIRRNVSVGYRVNRMLLTEAGGDGKADTYRVTEWEPLEVSIVSVPADKTVGVGREDGAEYDTTITQPAEEKQEPGKEEKMPDNQIDVKAETEKVRKAELTRASEIRAIGKAHGMEADAEAAIAAGTDIADFRANVLDELAKKSLKPVETPTSDIGMGDKEVKRFSILRAIRALANGRRDAAEYEFECSDAVAKRLGKDPQGIFVPSDVLKRDMNVATSSQGGYFVAENLLAGSFIEKLENSMVIMSLGARVLRGLVGDILIPKQSGGATAYWVGEGSDITESTPALAQVALRPRTVGAFTDLTRRFLMQSSIDAEMFVRDDLALRLALEIDATAYNGTGTGSEPLGIINTTGVGSVTINAQNTPDWGDIVDLETAVAVDNALVGSLAYVTNSTIIGKMKQTVKASTSDSKMILEDMNNLNGYRCVLSNQCPALYMLFGNWADLIIGFWGALDINVDTATLSKSGGLRVVALQDVDMALRHAESMAVGYHV